MAISNLFLLNILVVAAVSGAVIFKREIPIHEDSGFGYNDIHSYGHISSFKLPLPPAYSTISFLQSHHSKPVSYSAFTNHGRGHHDPGYAIEHRSEGFLPHHSGHHDYY